MMVRDENLNFSIIDNTGSLYLMFGFIKRQIETKARHEFMFVFSKSDIQPIINALTLTSEYADDKGMNESKHIQRLIDRLSIDSDAPISYMSDQIRVMTCRGKRGWYVGLYSGDPEIDDYKVLKVWAFDTKEEARERINYINKAFSA